MLAVVFECVFVFACIFVVGMRYDWFGGVCGDSEAFCGVIPRLVRRVQRSGGKLEISACGAVSVHAIT